MSPIIVQRDVSVVKCGVNLRVVMLALGLELLLYLIRRILIFFVLLVMQCSALPAVRHIINFC